MTEYSAQLAEAFREHRDLLYRVAIVRLRGAHLQDDAPDVVSAAMLSLLEHPVADVLNWRALLVDVVEKRALDHVRSAWARHRDGRETDLETVEDDRFEIANAEDAIDTLALLASATDALNDLPEPQRTVAYECLWRQRKQADVAKDLSVNQARVSQLLSQAKQMIRDKLKEKEVAV